MWYSKDHLCLLLMKMKAKVELSHIIMPNI